MKNFIASFCALILLGATNIKSQELTTNGTPTNRRFGYSLAYYSVKNSSFGLQAGIEKYLASTKNYQVLSSINLFSFSVKDVYTGFAINPRIGFRYTSNFGIMMESSIGFGYLQRFYQYNSYEVNDQGDVVSKGKSVQASAMPNVAVGIGYNLENKLKLPFLLFLRGSMNYYYPNKHFIFETHMALESGIVFRPNLKK